MIDSQNCIQNTKHSFLLFLPWDMQRYEWQISLQEKIIFDHSLFLECGQIRNRLFVLKMGTVHISTRQ